MERALQNITLPVDADAALAYQTASNSEKVKLQLLVSAMLKQHLDDTNIPSLIDIMDKMGSYAAKQGLTEEKLRELLNEDD